MNEQKAAERVSNYRADIDGLRAIAVSFVVLFHAQVSSLGSGFVGVDIFFVISGFLIGGIIIKSEKNHTFSFADFYARRARRILPALISVVMLTCAFGALVLTQSELRDLAASGLSALSGLSNISFWKYQDYFNSDSSKFPFLMTWSLGVEEQFYVFFPFFILSIARFGLTALKWSIFLLLLVSFGVSLYLTKLYPSAAFYLLPARAWELAAGALLAALRVDRENVFRWVRGLGSPLVGQICSVVGLLMLFSGAFAFSITDPFPGWIALIPVIGTIALISSEGSLINRWLLSWPPLVLVGRVSYSWYLWHWPMMSFVHIILPGSVPSSLLIGVALLSLVAAFLSWRFIEQPFRHRSLPSNKVLIIYGLALLCALSITAGIKYGNGLPVRLAPDAQDVERTLNAGRGNCLAGFSQDALPVGPDCVSHFSYKTRVVLLGDSHAAAIGPALREVAEHDGWDINIWTKSSCGPLSGAENSKELYANFESICETFNSRAITKITSDPSIKTVVVAAYWQSYYNSIGEVELSKGLSNTLQALKNSHKNIILVEDAPTWTANPAQIKLAEVIPVRHYLVNAFSIYYPDHSHWNSYTRQSLAVDLILKKSAASTGAYYFETSANLCPYKTCQYDGPNGLYFIDHHHLSKAGAQVALQNLSLK